MSLKDKIKKIKSGKLSAVKNVMGFSKKIATPRVKDLNIFLRLNENAIEQAKGIDRRIREGKKIGKLAGLCFAVKSNISVKGLETTCGSKVLEGYVSGYNATVINKLFAEDAIVLGMVNMDEFAAGASGETSAFGPTKNPKNPELIPGGSSSGPAAAVTEGLCDFSLGSDTGGSIRNPASHCGVVGFKPSYGAVSRYGLIDLAMSFDCIGPFANSSEDAKLVFDVIKGQDNFDQTTKELKGKREFKETIGLVDVRGFCDKEIADLVEKRMMDSAKKNKWKIKKIKLPLDIALETYFIIVYTEFFSSTRRFDGRRFGKRIEEFAGPEVVRRIVGGSEITKEEHEGRYYSKALRARNFVKREFEKIFSGVDAVVMPTVPKIAHKIEEKISVRDMYNYDVLTTPASIAGLPAISIPAGKVDGKDVGVQIIAPYFNDDMIFKVAKGFEDIET